MTISLSLRRYVIERATHRCEYCLLHQDHNTQQHEIDHVIPRKHNGDDREDNLAWACFYCNRFKGSEIAAYDEITGQLTRLFDPRQDSWDHHFVLDEGVIVAQSSIGRATVRILQLNRSSRISKRRILQQAGLYP